MKKKVLLKDLVSSGTHIRKTVVPKTVLSDGEYPVGEIWDANTIMKAVTTFIVSGGYISTDAIPDNSVGSRNIIDGIVELEDLSDEIKNKINVTVDEDDENVNFGSLS